MEKIGYAPIPSDFQSDASTKLASSPYVGRIGLEPTFSTITLLQRIRLGGYLPIFYPRFQRTILGGRVGNRTLSL